MQRSVGEIGSISKLTRTPPPALTAFTSPWALRRTTRLSPGTSTSTSPPNQPRNVITGVSHNSEPYGTGVMTLGEEQVAWRRAHDFGELRRRRLDPQALGEAALLQSTNRTVVAHVRARKETRRIRKTGHHDLRAELPDHQGADAAADEPLIPNQEVERRRRRILGTDGVIVVSADEVILQVANGHTCLLYTSPSPRDRQKSR